MLWLILALVFVAVGLLCLAVGWAGGRAEGAREAISQVKPMLDEMHWLLRQLGKTTQATPPTLIRSPRPAAPAVVLRPRVLHTPEPYFAVTLHKGKQQ